MPSEINNSVVSAASLRPRSTPQSAQAEIRSRDNSDEANTANPQAVLASRSENVVRAPDPGTGGQGAENEQDPGSSADGGQSLGGNADVTI